MPANYTAVDALTHTRELLKNTLVWVHEHLAAHYGLEWVDGEENLPEPLNEVMAALYSIADGVTDMAVDTGVYRCGEDGELMRPRYYSTAHPVYSQRLIGSVSEEIEVTCLEHPNGTPHPTAETYLNEGGGSNE